LAGLASLGAPALSRAQDNPLAFGGPITLIAGFPPGGSSDIMARIVAERLASSLGRTVIVDNRPGAGGRIAAAALRGAPPDGSRLLLANTAIMVLGPLANADSGYDPVADFAPIARAADFHLALATGPMTRCRDVEALTRWLRDNPTLANYGVPAAGSLPHLMGIALARSIGLPFTMVPYRGGAPIVTDLAGGRLAMGLSASADFVAQHRADAITMLAVSGTRRAPGLPDVPTFAERGRAGFEANGWNGFFAPAGTLPNVVALYSREIRAALAQADVRQRLEQAGFALNASGPAELGLQVEREIERYRPLLREAGLI